MKNELPVPEFRWAGGFGPLQALLTIAVIFLLALAVRCSAGETLNLFEPPSDRAPISAEIDPALNLFADAPAAEPLMLFFDLDVCRLDSLSLFGPSPACQFAQIPRDPNDPPADASNPSPPEPDNRRLVEMYSPDWCGLCRVNQQDLDPKDPTKRFVIIKGDDTKFPPGVRALGAYPVWRLETQSGWRYFVGCRLPADLDELHQWKVGQAIPAGTWAAGHPRETGRQMVRHP